MHGRTPRGNARSCQDRTARSGCTASHLPPSCRCIQGCSGVVARYVLQGPEIATQPPIDASRCPLLREGGVYDTRNVSNLINNWWGMGHSKSAGRFYANSVEQQRWKANHIFTSPTVGSPLQVQRMPRHCVLPRQTRKGLLTGA